MHRRAFCIAATETVAATCLAPRRSFSGSATPDSRTFAGNSGAEVTVTATGLAALERGFQGDLLFPDDAAYESARRLWNGAFDSRPALIARCGGTADVVRCVQFVRAHDLLTAVRGGGHSFAGHSTCPRGFVIDLSGMRDVRVDRGARLVHASCGALLSDVDRATLAAGCVTGTGTISDTGVAGLALGGGFGRIARRIGLACDNLHSAQIVTAEGQLLTVSAQESPDLYWAIRGGGGNFGVVTRFDFRVHDAPPSIIGGGLVYPFVNARAWLRDYADFTAGASDEFCGMIDFVPTPDGGRAIALDVCHSGTPAAAERELAALRKIGKAVEDTAGPASYLELQSRLDAEFPRGRGYYIKSGFVRETTPDFIDTLVGYLEDTPRPRHVASLLQLGGAISRVEPTATAYWHRGAAHQVLLGGMWDDQAHADGSKAWVRTGWKQLEPHTTGFYVNLLSPDESAHRVRATYGGNYDRLSTIKRRYDPDNLFRRNANIPPMAA
jgi:FAD/FMN-containing dehydrogenase